MKNLLALAFMLSSVLFIVSCTDDETPEVEILSTEVKTGVLTADETWTANRIWELKGRVIVPSGITLKIEAGTIIKGQAGEAANASVLIIAQGGKIDAVGTAAKPIIFTSVDDNIKIGEKIGTSLDKTKNELWGGIIMLGKAPISAKAGDASSSIEGLPPSETYAVYGGSVAADNSGTLKYVSIRHGGITIGAGNEINGLTLGGVGSGTTIDNVEIFATLDDGIEFFGGTVNVTNLLVAWQGDDGVDIDQNYSGTVNNFFVTQGAGVGTDEGLEIDGPESSAKDGLFTLKNGTLKSDGVEGSAADFKSDAQGTINNLVFIGYKDGAKLKIEGEYDTECVRDASKVDALGNFIAGTLKVENTNYGSLKVYSKEDDNKNPLCGDAAVIAADKVKVDAEASVSTTATGADLSVFAWTAAKEDGLLD